MDFKQKQDFVYTEGFLYTQNFLKNLKNLLGSPEDFKKLSLKNQQSLQNKIMEIFDDETSWKYNLKDARKFDFNFMSYYVEFNSEFKIFESCWNNEILNTLDANVKGPKRLTFNVIMSKVISIFLQQLHDSEFNSELLTKKIRFF